MLFVVYPSLQLLHPCGPQKKARPQMLFRQCCAHFHVSMCSVYNKCVQGCCCMQDLAALILKIYANRQFGTLRTSHVIYSHIPSLIAMFLVVRHPLVSSSITRYHMHGNTSCDSFLMMSLQGCRVTILLSKEHSFTRILHVFAYPWHLSMQAPSLLPCR
jgi:hypothetical protein